jgi:WD40 repeat protein
VQAICESTNALGTVWTSDDTLIIGGNPRGLLRVPVSGGTPRVVEVTGGPNDVTRPAWPVLLPGGKKLMYVVNRSEGPAALMLAELQPDGNLANPREIVASRHGAQYITDSAGRGNILFVRGTSLLAQAFDPLSAAVSGDSIVITEGIGIYLTRAFFAAANGGTIVFRNGETVGVHPEFVDLSGKGEVVKSAPGSLSDLTVSPDGGRILATVTKPDGRSNIWVLDPQRGAHTRATFDDVSASRAVWSPDGTRIVYTADGLWVKSANGSGVAEKLAPSPILPWSWSHDGKHILVSLGRGAQTQPGLYLLPLDGDRKPVPALTSTFVLSQAQFSQDDRWVTYVSDESGESEVYVQRFPPTGERLRISTSGGVQPRWRRDGRELFYVEPGGKLMAVALRYGKTLQADVPAPLFDTRLTSFTPTTNPRYDVTPDGKHFYISRLPEAQSTSSLRVILNWSGDAK